MFQLNQDFPSTGGRVNQHEYSRLTGLYELSEAAIIIRVVQ